MNSDSKTISTNHQVSKANSILQQRYTKRVIDTMKKNHTLVIMTRWIPHLQTGHGGLRYLQRLLTLIVLVEDLLGHLLADLGCCPEDHFVAVGSGWHAQPQLGDELLPLQHRALCLARSLLQLLVPLQVISKYKY